MILRENVKLGSVYTFQQYDIKHLKHLDTPAV